MKRGGAGAKGSESTQAMGAGVCCRRRRNLSKASVFSEASVLGAPRAEHQSSPRGRTMPPLSAKARAAEEFQKGSLTLADENRIDVSADDILARP